MMTDWDWKRVYLEEHPICEVCEERPPKDLGHCIFGRDTNYKKWVDVEHNLEATCDYCNRTTKKPDRYEERMKALMRKVQRHGYDFIREWLDSFPGKKKLGRDWREADTWLKGMVAGCTAK